jgi:hypothetical protein
MKGVPIMNKPFGRVVFVLLTLAILLAVGGVVVAADAQSVGSRPSSPISEPEAVADAMRQLPNNGAGYTIEAVQLEPSSSHFDFSGPNGQGFGEDQVKECLVIPPLPPLPFLTPCRYYPVWVVALSSQTCDVVIAINALTGRFGGGGAGSRASAQSTSSPVDSCAFSPDAGPTTPGWLQPGWD